MNLETARGVKDIEPRDKIIRNYVVRNLTEVFEKYGYSPFETPIIERYDVLSAKGGAGKESDVMKETFKLTDQGKRRLGLRFELTLSFCRYIGMNPNLKMPFKRYEVGPVFRDGPIKLGRYRQFWQCDVDIVGTRSVVADAELIFLALDCFRRLNLEAYLEVNNRKLLKAIIDYAGIQESKANSVIISIDKLAKIGKSGVKIELIEKELSEKEIKKLFTAFDIEGSNKQKINELRKILLSDLGKKALDETEELFSYIENKDVIFNIALARGLGYYTGSIFEGFLKKSQITGSICGGGRYDNMIGDLLSTEKEYPATGISFGLDVITDALKCDNKQEQESLVKVYVIPIKTLKESLGIAQELRRNNLNTDIDLIGKGISKNLDYANALKIPYVLFVGPKELEINKVKLRDMKTGKEELLSVKQVIKQLL